MQKHLILFFGSENVGPYINVLAHTIDKYRVDRVFLISLIKSPLNLRVEFADLDDSISATLRDLRNNKYENQDLQLPTNFKTYENAKSLFADSSTRIKIEYNSLEEELVNIIKVKSDIDFIVDITCVPKRIAVDIILSCINIGIKDVQLFELKNQVKGVAALYHNLEEGKDYEYVNFSNLNTAINTRFVSNQTTFDKNIPRTTSLTILALSISINIIILLEFMIYRVPWYWLTQNPNSYGIQAALDLLVIAFIFGIIRPSWRKFCWGTGAFAIILTLTQILGGPKR